jgi:hypothetical protein
MARAEKYFIGPQLLGDIRRVVGKVDAEPIGSSVTRIPTHLQEMQRPAGLKSCSWAAEWPYEETTTVRFSGTSATASAVNTILGVGPGKGWVARNGQAGWTLISFDMTNQPGYQDSEIQMFGHDQDGIARWYSIAECDT